ncbi:hypothetical protein MTR_8g006900 [Medicago truncatula]|uniref:Uncharacterized protein n=1 Tax=Medicago truncatula TaxID=3880 RepID=A0A072TKZ3_MEDTR|nr:hypothetical protein MTR_8g006900 [Medicago truncatula]
MSGIRKSCKLYHEFSFQWNLERERGTITDLKRRSMAALLPRWAELEVVGNTGAAAMEVRPKGTCLSRYK